MKLLVCGSRDWADIDTIGLHMPDEGEDVTVIHGGAKGADMLAGIVAHGLGFAVEVYEADWKRDGKAAGPMRNTRMLYAGQPERGLAFGALWRRSMGMWKRTGTGDMVSKMLCAKVPVRWVAEPGAPAVDLVEMPRP